MSAKPAIDHAKLGDQLCAIVQKRIATNTLVLPSLPTIALKCLSLIRSPNFSLKDDNVLKVAGFQGRQDRQEKYYLRVGELLRGGIETVAAACFDDLIVDVSQMPRDPQRTAQLIIEVEGHGKKFGLSLRLVGSPEVAKLLKAFSETSQLPVFGTVEEAAAA